MPEAADPRANARFADGGFIASPFHEDVSTDKGNIMHMLLLTM